MEGTATAYPPRVRFDVVVVGGGTAGCVLAARLSEQSDRSVCLLEAGPDYGPLADGRWPPEMVDGRRMPWTHSWGEGGEDEQSLGARIISGCSSHNACVMVEGSPADYDEWGGMGVRALCSVPRSSAYDAADRRK